MCRPLHIITIALDQALERIKMYFQILPKTSLELSENLYVLMRVTGHKLDNCLRRYGTTSLEYVAINERH